MPDDFSPFDVATGRLAYAKGANSALGAAAVMIVTTIWFAPPSFGAFTLDQFIWGVAIFILLLSLPDFIAAVVALLRPAMSIFRFDAEGVRIGGMDTAIPWRQIVSMDIHREDDKTILQLAVRQPAPDLSRLMRRVYGLRAMTRGETIIYGIRRDYLASGDSELAHGLERVANRLART